MGKTCACLGEKPILYSFGYDEEYPTCVEIKNLLAALVLIQTHTNTTKFLTNMELGAGMWLAEIVSKMKKKQPDIRLEAILPSESQATKWTSEQRHQYFTLLSDCDSTKFIATENLDESIKKSMQEMIKQSDDVIFICTPQQLSPLLAEAADMAQEQQCQVTYINPETLDIMAVNR